MTINILLDENFPRPLRRYLTGHQVTTVQKMEWLEAENGDLLAIAEAEFDVLLSTDKNMKYQQNFTARDIAVITLRAVNNRIETLEPLMPQVLALLPTVQPGHVYFVPV
jgi:predicted nuclease of predicted toxin-antitoxin system